MHQRPPALILFQPTGAPVPLLRHAEVIRPDLHPEVLVHVLADLLGVVAKRLDGLQRRVTRTSRLGA